MGGFIDKGDVHTSVSEYRRLHSGSKETDEERVTAYTKMVNL